MIWALWVAAVLGSFFALEIPALRNAKRGDTLSENLRLWFHTGNKWWRLVWLAVWGIAAAVFGFHIAVSGVPL